MPSQTASSPNRVRVISTGLKIPVPAPIEGANQPLYQHDSMKFQNNILLVARVIPDEFISTYSGLHFLPLVTNLFLPRVTLEVFNTLLQQQAFGDPIPDYHTTDPCEAYLIAPVIVDGIQFMGVVVIMKSYNLLTGDANKSFPKASHPGGRIMQSHKKNPDQVWHSSCLKYLAMDSLPIHCHPG